MRRAALQTLIPMPTKCTDQLQPHHYLSPPPPALASTDSAPLQTPGGAAAGPWPPRTQCAPSEMRVGARECSTLACSGVTNQPAPPEHTQSRTTHALPIHPPNHPSKQNSLLPLSRLHCSRTAPQRPYRTPSVSHSHWGAGWLGCG